MWENRSEEYLNCWMKLSPENKGRAFDCIVDVFDYLKTKFEDEPLVVLVTGSLYLLRELIKTITELEK